MQAFILFTFAEISAIENMTVTILTYALTVSLVKTERVNWCSSHFYLEGPFVPHFQASLGDIYEKKSRNESKYTAWEANYKSLSFRNMHRR